MPALKIRAQLSDLSPRARKILFAVVTEFIATGEPVGSRTLARKYGLDLSAASVRNVLADLEEAGYLKQPHTSAGRIPTDRALRLFIDTLIEVRALAPEEQARIGARFAEIYAVADDPLRETGGYSRSCRAPPRWSRRRGRSCARSAQLRFIPTQPGQLLAVLVFCDGTVENRFLPRGGGDPRERAQPHPQPARRRHRGPHARRGARLLRAPPRRRAGRARRLCDAAPSSSAAWRWTDVGRRGARSCIEGHARLIDLPEYADADSLKKLMRALEEREELIELLDKTLAAGAVTVFVGSEAGELGGGAAQPGGGALHRPRARGRARWACSGRRAWTTPR